VTGRRLLGAENRCIRGGWGAEEWWLVGGQWREGKQECQLLRRTFGTDMYGHAHEERRGVRSRSCARDGKDSAPE
jgi:hypothetical protein